MLNSEQSSYFSPVPENSPNEGHYANIIHDIVQTTILEAKNSEVSELCHIPLSFPASILKKVDPSSIRAIGNRFIHQVGDAHLYSVVSDTDLNSIDIRTGKRVIFYLELTNHFRGYITDQITALYRDLDRHIKTLKEAPQEKQISTLERLLVVFDPAHSKIRTSDHPNGISWRGRVSGEKPPADVILPTKAPELWLQSEEKRQADAKEMNRDDAVISFTARVYSGYLPGQQPVGIAITDFKDKGLDEPLYDEWVALKNRRSGRTKNTEWPEGAPFQSRNARNDYVAGAIRSGELLPPSNPNVYASMRSSFKKMYNFDLNDYLPHSLSR
jgi:hypothetical protein